ncbi:type IV pilus assembly protein PilN [Anaerosolibacter carboniphilus]|uniref:Type IV pilus assembly protein PilN n=1 Tax=Anaerosolibacter carboniphilus TaxID=1417629 RepID=A0A841KT61_9FIRM|nr:PilN domain-containing protein [Anaerosolibacter carboniphilus]MBB6216607.1 type IV pilus assembly protein PilN [Anaerosolibacter carboniphilus]
MRDYNFFEPYITKKRSIGLTKASVTKLIIGIAFVLVILPLVNLYLIHRLENEAAHVNQLAYSTPDYQQRKEIEAKENTTKQKQIYLEKLKDLDRNMTNMDIINDLLLYAMNDAVPEGLFFQSISLDMEKVQIQGIAESRVAIAEFQHNLKKTPNFQEVFVSTISFDSGVYSFDISFLIKDVSKRETN